MFGTEKAPRKQGSLQASENGKPTGPSAPLLTVVGDRARMEGKFDIADSIQIECEIGGEMNVGGKLVIGGKGVVNASGQTLDAIITGHFEGNKIATRNAGWTQTGRGRGTHQTQP